MKYIFILIMLLTCGSSFAQDSAKDILQSLDRQQLTQNQQRLLDKALTQKDIEFIKLEDQDLNELQNKFSNKESQDVLYKLRMRHIKNWLQTTDQSKTCLDEYLYQRKRHFRFPLVLLIDTSVGVAVAALSGGWVPTLTASFAFVRFFLSETIASRILRLRYPNIRPGGWNAYEFDAIANSISAAILIPYYTGGILSLVRAFQAGFIMKAIFNTKDFSSKHIYKFQRKYLRKYPQDQQLASIDNLKSILDEADKTGALCDGSIVESFNPRRYRRGRKLKQRLARKKEIFQYIHQKLK